jgi:hypothetical protein
MQHLDRGLPVAAIHQIIPIWNDVVDRATLVTERDAAVHAARALLTDLLVRQGDQELVVVDDAIAGWLIAPVAPADLDESGWLTHDPQYPPSTA